MKTIAVSSIVVFVLLVVFVLAIVTGTAALAIIPFCGWTPAILILGYAVGRAGLSIKVSASGDDIRPSSNHPMQRQSRIRKNAG